MQIILLKNDQVTEKYTLSNPIEFENGRSEDLDKYKTPISH